MSETPHQIPASIEDYVDLLRFLEEEGLAFAVIGGCAVGLYARLAGMSVVSEDLDIYVTHETLEQLLNAAPSWGASIIKRPQPRSVPVAVLEWNGRELNALTSSDGLARPDVVIDGARVYELTEAGISVPVADPFELLANKLSVRRPKDLPHIDALKAFLRREVLGTFPGPGSARDRSAAARRYLEVLGLDALDEQLVLPLAEAADLPALRRFLASRWPAATELRSLLDRATGDAERAQLQEISKRS